MNLTEEQLTHFNEQGYLIIEDVISDADIDAVRQEYEQILDREAPRLVAEGRLSQTYAELPFEERYTKMLNEIDDMYALYQHLDISLPLLEQIPADAQMNAGPAVFNHLLANEKILDIAEAILGPEVYSNPVQHTRIKPPKSALPQDVALDSNVARTFWHQDEAVLTEDAVGTAVLTVWVAMTDATVKNGCMVCIPGSHQEPTMHCPDKGASASEIYIPDELIDEEKITPMPVKKGGVVLLHHRTEHAALDNLSDRIRWSFDLRYNVTGSATGRDVFPGFVARSKAHPDQELRDAAEWKNLWRRTRDELSTMDEVAFNERWVPFARHALCA